MNIIQSELQSISPRRSLSDNTRTSGVYSDSDKGDPTFSKALSNASIEDDKLLNSDELVLQSEMPDWTALAVEDKALMPVTIGLATTEVDSELIIPVLSEHKLTSGNKLPASGIGLPESGFVKDLLSLEDDNNSNLTNSISYQLRKDSNLSPGLTESTDIKLKVADTELADFPDHQRRDSLIQGQSSDQLALNSRLMVKDGLEMSGSLNQDVNSSLLQPDEVNLARPINTSGLMNLRPAFISDPAMTNPIQNMVLNPQGDARVWGEGLGERLNWMVNQKMNNATIRLDPPSLGKLEVHINVSTDSTTVTINTHQTQTREMIENSSHRLRDILEENGFTNVNVDVSHQQQGGSEENAQLENFEQLHSSDADEEVNLQSDPSTRQGSTLINRLIDYFA